MRKYLSIITLISIVMLGCSSPKPQFARVEGAMLGTTLTIIADVECPPALLYSRVMQLDSTFKAEMSLFDPTSLLSRINRGECDSLSESIIYNLQLSDSVSRISGGAYDITVAPLVKALGFAAKEEMQQHPNIDSIMEFVGYDKISVSNGRLVRQDPRTQLDFNSVAKGYVVDQVAQLVASLGAQNYMVDIGGEIFCNGTNPYSNPWRIGIESPFDGNMTNGEYIEKRIAIPPTSPYRAMATSGNYRRYYLDQDGNKVAHTIDPTTGESKLSPLLSATVIAPNCALADAYGTMFMALGLDAALQKVTEITNAEVYFIFADPQTGEFKEFLSDGMRQYIMVN